MKRMFRNIVVLAAMMLMFVFDMQGQVDAQLSQYWAIPTYYNAGASGSSDYLRINGGARLQWLGIENAPQSFLGQVDMPLNLFGKRIGVGAGLQSETMGLFSNLNINAQFSYKIKLLLERKWAILSRNSTARRWKFPTTTIIMTVVIKRFRRRI